MCWCIYKFSEAFVENEFKYRISIRLLKMPELLLNFVNSQTSILGVSSYSKRNCTVKFKADGQNLHECPQVKVARHQMLSFDSIKYEGRNEDRHCEEKARVSCLIDCSMSCNL